MIAQQSSTADIALEAALGFVFGIVGATVLIALPGYVLISTATRGRSRTDLSDREFITRTAVGGILVHAVFVPWTVDVFTKFFDAPELTDAATWTPVLWWAIVVLIAAPVVVGLALATLMRVTWPKWFKSLLNWLGVSETARADSAWDYATKTSAYVRVWIKRGETIVPVWGLFWRHSAASTAKEKNDLYLEAQYAVDEDGWVGEPLPGTAGIWISADSIIAVEFFDAS